MQDTATARKKIAENVLRDLEQGKSTDVLLSLDDSAARLGDDATGVTSGPLEQDIELMPAIIAEPMREQLSVSRAARYRLLQERVLAFAPETGLTLLNRYDNLPLLHFKVSEVDALIELLQRPEVSGVYEDIRYEHQLARSLPLIQQPAVSEGGLTGEGTSIAVLDTGCDYTLPDFGSCTNAGTAGCKVAYAADFAPNDGSRDDNGHGTNVSAIVVGVAPGAKVLALDVFDGGTAPWSAILSALDWVIANRTTYNIVGVNMSLGGGQYSAPCSGDAMSNAIANARSVGILSAIASGNNGWSQYLSAPGCASTAISVGAVYSADFGGLRYSSCSETSTSADKITCFSNSAPFLSVLAPGALITAGGHTMAGTSQATPHIAGAIAVLRSAFPDESIASTVARITDSGPVITDGRNGIIKHRLDLLAALNGEGLADRTAPAGSIKINDGAAFTNTTEVQLTLTGSDNESSVEICVSNTPDKCTTFESLVGTRAWTLPNGDGLKTVYLTLKDASDNATVVSDTIVLDTTGPSGSSLSIVPADGAVYLNWTKGSDAGSGVSAYRLVVAPDAAPSCSEGTPLYSGGATSFVHSDLRNGATYGYRLCLVDAAGNVAAGPTGLGKPDAARGTPFGAVIINGDAEYTNSQDVILTLTATDTSDAAEMCVSNSDGCTSWTSFVPILRWHLDAVSGTATVRVWFKDGHGVATPTSVSDSILIDVTAPSSSTLSAQASDGQVALRWTVSSDAASGIAGYRIVAELGDAPSCQDGVQVYQGTGTTFTHTHLQNGLIYGYRVCPYDVAGNVSEGTGAVARPAPEYDAPVGEVSINDGAAYTNQADVTLTLSATDASGVADMCISNSQSCQAWLPFAQSVPWTLSVRAADAKVYVWFRDVYGSSGAAVTDSIVVDTTPPSNGQLSAVARNAAVSLTWSGATDATSGVASYKLVGQLGDPPGSCDGPELYSGADTSFEHTSLQNGQVYGYRLCPIDGASNLASGATASAQPVPEFDPPVGGIVINDDAPYAASSAVTLTVSASDASGVAQMCIANTPACTSWTGYTNTLDWKLDKASGSATVYAWFRDIYGNTSTLPVSDMIVIDSQPPSGGQLTATPDNASVKLSWSGVTDAGSGVAGYKLVGQLGEAPGCSDDKELYRGPNVSFTHTGLQNGKVYGYRLCPMDAAGNMEEGPTASARPAPEFDPPLGHVLIDGDAPYTASAQATLTLTATDDSGVAQMCVSNTASCTTWTSYASSQSWTLDTRGAGATVYAWFRDSYGNTSTQPVSDSILIDATPPTPGALTAVPEDGRVKLSWSAATDAVSGVQGYKLVVATGDAPSCSQGTQLFNGPGRAYTHEGLQNGTTYGYRLCPYDRAGNESSGVTTSARPAPEFEGPSGSVVINANAPYTATPDVALALSALDASPVTQMCISNGSSCTQWQAFASTLNWQLSERNATATVRAWFRDSYGNESPTAASDSIIVDTTAPTSGMLTGAPGDGKVTLTWTEASDALSGVSGYKLVAAPDTIPDCDTGATIYAGPRTTATHSGLQNGRSYGYRICPLDAAGNVGSGATALLTPAPEFDAPGGAVMINDDAPYTNDSVVTLTLSAVDQSGVTQMCISNTPSCSSWTEFKSSVLWTVPLHDGSARVYVWFKDTYGNINQSAYSDSIVVDSTAPVSGELSATRGNASVALSWAAATDAGSGIASYRLYYAQGSVPDCSGTPIYSGPDTSFTQSGLHNGTLYGYRICPVDGAGNVGSGATLTARPSPEFEGPTCTVSINEDAPYTRSTGVTLSLTASDPSGVSEMCISNSDRCDDWLAASSSLSWTLGAFSGNATVRAWFKDSYDNVSARACSDTIVVDSTPPSGGTLAASAGSAKVHLAWTEATDSASGIAAYRVVVSTDAIPSCAEGWPIYTGMDLEFTHKSLDNGKLYMYRLCPIDAAGNMADGPTASAFPAPEFDGPEGSVLINAGAEYTQGRAVTLSLSAKDPHGVAQMCISNSSSCNSWLSFAETAPWNLAASEDGLVTVYVWFKDDYGNVSAQPVTDTIRVDAVAPTSGTLTATAADASVLLSWTQASDAQSGLGGYRLVVQQDSVPTCSSGTLIYSGSALSYTHAGLTNGQLYGYRLCPVDRAGNVADGPTATARPKPESDGPVGHVQVNDGAEYTNKPDVTLTLWAEDASGVAQMCISNSSSTCTQWSALAASLTWKLNATAGVATVYAWFKDNYGNVSATAATDSIVIDMIGPRASNLSATPADASVSLSWTATDEASGVAQYRLMSAPDSAPSCTEGSPVYTGRATQFTHTGLQNGVLYAYRICPIDGAGNLGSDATASARPAPEFVGPTGSVVINADEPYTNSVEVALALTAQDASDVTGMCISNTATCTNWSGFAPNAPWTLAPANGTATVRVWFQDSYSNVTEAPVSDSIVLDTMPPNGGVLTATPGDAAVQLSWSAASDATSGVVAYKLLGALGSVASCSDGEELYRGMALSYTHSGLDNGALYAYRLCAVDKAGNVAVGQTASARPAPEFDPPTGRVVIEGGARIVATRSVNLSLSATDASEVTDMCLSNTASCREWTPFASSASWTLGPSSGPASVRAWFRDQYGNQMTVPTSATTIVDMEGPVMGSLHTLATIGTVYVSWSSANDLAGVASYTLVRQTGGTAPESCAQGEVVYSGGEQATSHTLPAGVYSYRLCATDSVGNVSAGVTRTVNVP